MRRSSPLRRTPLRRGRPAKAIQRDIWREGLGPCVICRSAVNVDAHHIVKAQTLRKFGHHDYLMDKRNRLSLCRHHHARYHAGLDPIPLSMLPVAVLEFAAELGLTWYLEKHYTAKAAA